MGKNVRIIYMKKDKLILLVLIILAIFVLPLKNINWGKMSLVQDQGITVVGEAKTKLKNQVASFAAGVNVNKASKEEAVKEVNEKMKKLIEDVKAFGIKEGDIKTQGISINESERYETRQKEWYVSNSIEIILREVDKTSDLTDLLSKSGANNVYGPNLRLEENNDGEKVLYEAAIKDAREKAEAIAKASGRKLGKIISVTDGGTVSDYNRPWLSSMAKEGMGGADIAAPVEPGVSTVSKSMTVVFEMR